VAKVCAFPFGMITDHDGFLLLHLVTVGGILVKLILFILNHRSVAKSELLKCLTKYYLSL
jgi:hypothetical protein